MCLNSYECHTLIPVGSEYIKKYIPTYSAMNIDSVKIYLDICLCLNSYECHTLIPVGSEYIKKYIPTYSAMNIDSVKINTSLTMMREWQIQKT